MGKQPATGQKKTKDAIAKAATQQKKKAGAKKWTKGKVHEKSDHAVFLDQATYDRLITSIPKLGRHISISAIIEKYKVVGSVARQLVRKCVADGKLRSVEAHSRQALYTPTEVIVEKTATTTEAKEGKKGKKK